MKEKLKSLIEQAISQWEEKDIYAISLYIQDEEDDPCRPTVTLGYNTEEQVTKALSDASDEQEARWNYAFWIQNEELCWGRGGTEKDVREWIAEKGFEQEDEYEITEAFVELLVDIVSDLHQSGLLKNKFGKEIPVLIHELEYYDAIAEQNIWANGKELVSGFADFCIQG